MSEQLGATIADLAWAQGELKARREDLLLLLRSRFGEIPEALIERINATQDSERLHQAFQQALRIDKLDELLL